MATSGEALHQLKATDPTHWLTPSTALSQTARAASQYLFSSLKPYTPKTPFDQLLVDGFDAEQIWQQIDLQSQPLLSSIKRDLKRFQKNPDELRKLKVVVGGEEKILDVGIEEFDVERDDFDEDIHGLDDDDDDDDDDDEDNDEEEEAGGKEGKVEKENTSDEGESEGEEKESEGEDEEEEGGDGSGAGIEDEFLKLKDLEDFLEDDEAREYGLKKKKAKNMNDKKKDDDESLDEEDGEDEEAEDEDDSDEFGDLGLGDDGDEETEKLENARYEEFFGTKKKKSSQRKSKPIEDSEDNDEEFENQNNFSTHEKELMKRKSEIEKLEREKLEPKAWTMQGEVAAANRPKNSALEVDIDFKHNMRPPPVITEEFTASIEEMIYKRILEGHFDDVQKAPTIHSKAPREIKELDETKSKKGLGEVYEEEYVQKTNLASAPLSTTDELKKEASMLFKKLCLKLDALSHFHFTPKPVIEDMSIQVNVPALAMEETAPVAVSDAAMLAPEEVFAGKGDIKDEGELTQAERKRRRANKKRKYKVETVKRMAKKPRDNNLQNHKEDS